VAASVLDIYGADRLEARSLLTKPAMRYGATLTRIYWITPDVTEVELRDLPMDGQPKEANNCRLYKAETLSDVPQAFDAITDELGRQYSLGYYPKGQVQPGEKRDIKVRTRSPNLVVRARESYVASATAPHQSGQD
jgi:hypothetical protein